MRAETPNSLGEIADRENVASAVAGRQAGGQVGHAIVGYVELGHAFIPGELRRTILIHLVYVNVKTESQKF